MLLIIKSIAKIKKILFFYSSETALNIELESDLYKIKNSLTLQKES